MDYCGPFIYRTSSGTRSLKYITTPEGRVQIFSTSVQYDYNLTDHLGNTRAIISKDPSTGLATIDDEWHYYPFGMEMSDPSSNFYPGFSNPYLYNGKEFENDFDLGYYD